MYYLPTRHPNLSQGEQDGHTELVQLGGLQAGIDSSQQQQTLGADKPVENIGQPKENHTHQDVDKIIQSQAQHQVVEVFLFL